MVSDVDASHDWIVKHQCVETSHLGLHSEYISFYYLSVQIHFNQSNSLLICEHASGIILFVSVPLCDFLRE